MRFKKVIYIRYIPLTKKVYQDFYMEEVSRVGIEVEYWDITSLFFKDSYEQEDSELLTKTLKFSSYMQLEKAFVQNAPLSEKLFISIMTFEGRVKKLHRLFTKYDCKIAIFGRNMFPMPNSYNPSLFAKIKSLTAKRLSNFVKTKALIIAKKRKLIKPFDFLFLAGDQGWKGIGRIKESEILDSHVIKINSNDYDNILMSEKIQQVVNCNYILFLDEYLPLHPDTLLFGIKNVSPEQYYPELNAYFDHVEKQFNMPVIISAHPKAIRYKTEDFFNGRSVYFNKTLELTKYADFVLAHDTTSINYPIIFEKKLHFITSEKICKEINEVHKNTINFAQYLKCNMQWFDKNEFVNLVEEIPEEEYKKYKYQFQTSYETENALTKDVFIDFLLS